MRRNICNVAFLTNKISNYNASYFSEPNNTKNLTPS